MLFEAAWICCSIIVAPFFALMLLVTFAALLGPVARAPAADSGSAQPPQFLFIIPAHDEEGTIRRTIESCRAVDYASDQFAVCVIADNCTDATAEVACAAGAEVVERFDAVRRGKGFALEDFFEGRRQDPFDAVVVIDADSVVDSGILHAFAAGLAEGHDWMQCYDTVSNRDSSWRTRLMTYAFSLINGVWLLGQQRLGLGVALRGNGMCFATRGLSRVSWHVHGLTEDLEFSWTLRIAGERAHFVPEACVRADMLTRGGPAAVAQRRRWEAGRRALRAVMVGPLLRSRRIGLYRKLLYLIDLFFPSLVGLSLVLLLAASVHLGPLFRPEFRPLSRALLLIHAAMFLTLAAYALSPMLIMRLPVRYLAALLVLPYYVFWKTAAVLRHRPAAWVRTAREPSRSEGDGS